MRRLINVLFFFILFFLRLQFLPKHNLKDGQLIRVTGKIGEEPQATGNIQKFKVGEFEIVTERYPEFEYEDEIVVEGSIRVENCHPERVERVEGSLSTVTKARDSSTRSFLTRLVGMTNIAAILNSRCYSLSFPKISLAPTLRRDSVSGLARPRLAAGPRLARLDIKGLAIKLRRNLREVYKKVFISPFDGIVAGIVLGDKTLLPAYFYENLKKTGTLHILVASGMNISMMSLGILNFFCLFLKRKKAVLLLIVLIWFYSLMTGLQSPIIRAAVMASVVFLGEFFGRKVEGERALWIAGLLMVFINPYLIMDVGFQLSFMATAGLVYIQPVLKEKINKSEITNTSKKLGWEVGNESGSEGEEWVKDNITHSHFPSSTHFSHLIPTQIKNVLGKLVNSDNFTSSLSAQIATLPILFIAFGQFNLLSPIINLMILWTIPLILQVGGAIGIIGLFGTIGLDTAKAASYPFIPLLFYLEQIINWSAKITIFQIKIIHIPWLIWVIYYLALVIWIKIRNPKFKI